MLIPIVYYTIKDLTSEETDLIDRLLSCKVYDDLFQELYENAYNRTPADISSNTMLDKWHFLWLSTISEETRLEFKRASVQEIAVQFRDYDSIPRITFSWFGVSYIPGFNTDISPTCATLVAYVLPGNLSYYL